MISFVAARDSTIAAHLAELRQVDRSRRFARFRLDVQAAAIRGNRDAALAGLDGHGRPVAPLSPNSRKSGKYKGATGPPRAPFRQRSRLITQFRAVWREAGDGAWELIRYWDDFESRDGFPIPRAFATGTRTMPRRDPGPITPATHAEFRRLFDAFLDDLTRPA